jgi:preprotein translocase subunit SecD
VARPTRAARPGRALLALLALLIVLYGVVVSAHVWGTGTVKPKLGLDLEGGDEIVLEPIAAGGKITKGQIDEAVKIIRARVDGSGVSEAQVSTQGSNNIVVALPGQPSEATKNLVKKAAQLTFRPVIAADVIGAPATPTGTATPSGTATGTATTSPTGTPTGSSVASATGTSSTAGRAIPGALARSGTATATPASAPTSATPTATGTTPTAKPTDASDPNWVTPALQQQYDAETCANLNKFQGVATDPAKPVVTCGDSPTEKFILGPVELNGTDIKSANAQLETNSQGVQTTVWEVQLNFTGSGTTKFGKVTQRLFGYGTTDTRNRFAIIVDGVVISAPQTNQPIFGGQASITGPTIDQKGARELANQLKYGALPLSFKTLTENSISPTLGQEQLNKSLLAGLVGLLLVVLYAFFQYRLLGLVTVASLAIAASLTYGMVVYLGWAQGFRLTLAGVTGLIVSIGITADSFIVFFERVRDEVRDGRALRSAVESGWKRAQRTILAADSVSFLAAVVLYLLATGGVQGFAYTLGLTTLIDVLVVFLFTHPMLALLSRTRFFGEGHRWSGLDPERLGVTARRRRTGPSVAVPATAGAGIASSATASPSPTPSSSPSTAATARSGDTIAARRAAARKAAQSGEDA